MGGVAGGTAPTLHFRVWVYLEPSHFLLPVRPRFHRGHIPLLRKDQQQVLIGKQQRLAVAVAAGFPFRPGRFVQAYADEKAGVEAVDVLAMDDQVVEVGLDGGRLPNQARRPAIALVRNADQPRAEVKAGADQYVAIAYDRWLDGTPEALLDKPVVLPENLAADRVERR